ncbi:MAG: hypothetical protein LBH43_12570 [Treponema sp.]|nr:hypothetical protein [Treponema sp.]
MDNAIVQKILFEIEQIDQLVNDSSPLYNLCNIREPDFVETCGIALILHSFYNGVENIMLMIMKNKYNILLEGTKWHKDLLARAFDKTEDEPQLFRDDLKMPLIDYLQLRHFVRHTYGFKLKYEKMKHLFLNMKPIWEKIKEDIKLYINVG